eukprot:Stramenopile-MAST_4_protein_6825
MDNHGVPLDALCTIRDKLNVYSSAERCEYNGKTGVQLPNIVFQQREYVGNVIVRRESQLSDAEWATAKPLKAAVGDSGVEHVGAVVSVVNDEYTVRPAKTPEAFGHEMNYAFWEHWDDAIILKDLPRVTTNDDQG